MPQKKEAKTKIKVRDLKPNKDAKGGGKPQSKNTAGLGNK